METIPGAGKAGNPPSSGAALGPPNAAIAAAANATYSEVLASPDTTPIPPTSWPFLKIGTPPGFTAVGCVSFKSALPVVIPNPGEVPPIVFAGGTVALNPTARVHPRLVFSIPYSAALPVFITPGGK